MILLVLAALCVVSVPLTGGSLRRLATLQVRWLWLGPVAVVVQTALVTIAPGGSETVHAVIHVGTYVMLGAFLWANRRLAGVAVIAAGAFLNGLAITVNGGVMPAAATAERVAGLTAGSGFHNSAVVAQPHLLWFGDIIPVPGPLANVLSVGDCIIFAGLLFFLHLTCRGDRTEPAVLAAAPAEPVVG
ncbi:MAG TPA: DUF5317 family protein [Solirubrobacteraceae bacterium]|jgi:hypothetical protein